MATLVFIGHEASLTGAPYTQLYLIQWLRANTAHNIELVLIYGGPLEAEFAKVANVYVLFRKKPPTLQERIIYKAEQLTKFNFLKNRRERGILKTIATKTPGVIFANSAVSLEFAVKAKQALEIPLLLHIHELESSFFYVNQDAFTNNVKHVDFFITCSKAVESFYASAFAMPLANSQIVYDYSVIVPEWKSSAKEIRDKLNISTNAKIVGGAGTLGWRKGTDLFLQMAYTITKYKKHNIHFIWLGADPESVMYKELIHDAKLMGISDHFHLVSPQSDRKGYYQAFDVFTLTSREDPFPLVCMEAALLGCPIVCFADGGGMPEFVRNDAGYVTPYADSEMMGEKVVYLLQNEVIRQEMGKVAKLRAEQSHTIKSIGPELYEIISRFL